MSLERWARERAIILIQKERSDSHLRRAGSYWGKICERCGEQRPDGEEVGPVCACERARVYELLSQLADPHRPGVANAIIQRAGIPSRYQDRRFDNFEARPGSEAAAVKARVWADEFNLGTSRGLLLAGPFGSGKTHLATAILQHSIVRTMAEARFVTAGILLQGMRASSPHDWRPVDEAISVELLILDDLGQESGTAFARDVVSAVLSARYANALPTIITSNLGPQELTQRFGGALVSRLHEMVDVIPLTSSDYREHLARR